jgi:preprotein translocase subunit SecY
MHMHSHIYTQSSIQKHGLAVTVSGIMADVVQPSLVQPAQTQTGQTQTGQNQTDQITSIAASTAANSSNIILIAGAGGGGTVLVILFVIVYVCKARRRVKVDEIRGDSQTSGMTAVIQVRTHFGPS